MRERSPWQSSHWSARFLGATMWDSGQYIAVFVQPYCPL